MSSLPYSYTLTAWLRYNESTQVSSAVPFFWQGQPLTWQVLARVDDNATYCLFGCESAAVPVAQQTGISYTSTHTLIDLTAGSTDLVLDFFSPVSLTDYVRQSIPYSYLRVHNKGDQDGGKLDVMMAIDDTWTSQQPATQSELLQTPHGARGFILSGTESYTWAENNQMAAWGEVVLAARKGSSYQSGTVEDLVSQFSKNGCLSDQQAQYASGDLVGVASSLQSSGESVVFAIGVQQENAFNWLNVSQTGYYQASLNGTEAVVDHFFHDMGAALKEGTALDKRIMEIGQEISHNYTDVLASTVRQMWVHLIQVGTDHSDGDRFKSSFLCRPRTPARPEHGSRRSRRMEMSRPSQIFYPRYSQPSTSLHQITFA